VDAVSRGSICKVLDNERLRKRFHLLRLIAPSVAETCRPGQFVMLRSRSASWPYLNRPFSIYDSDGDSVVEIVYEVVGRATVLMARLANGDKVDIIGPLGTTFAPADDSLHVIAVAGGIGMPPLGFFCKRYATSCGSMTLVVGAKTGTDLLVPVGLMGEGVDVVSFTEDGSRGKRGLATDGLVDLLQSAEIDPSSVRIIACGPKKMLGEVHRIAENAGIACEVSVEEVMACGVGACMSCAVPAASGGYLHVCKDGPVVRSSDIDFTRWLET
jgi:dihydroorotate dehydrogenase electron transfer subunit